MVNTIRNQNDFIKICQNDYIKTCIELYQKGTFSWQAVCERTDSIDQNLIKEDLLQKIENGFKKMRKRF